MKQLIKKVGTRGRESTTILFLFREALLRAYRDAKRNAKPFPLIVNEKKKKEKRAENISFRRHIQATMTIQPKESPSRTRHFSTFG